MSCQKHNKIVRKKLSLSERLVDALRKMHPDKTALNVAADLQKAGLEISESAVQKWLSRSSLPGAEAIEALGEVYGSAFTAAVFPSWEIRAAETRANTLEKLNSLLSEANRLVGSVTNF